MEKRFNGEYVKQIGEIPTHGNPAGQTEEDGMKENKIREEVEREEWKDIFVMSVADLRAMVKRIPRNKKECTLWVSSARAAISITV